MRFLLDIAFDGAAYHGWQRQPGALTVQEVVENALSRRFSTPMAVVGAGRTDAGVNARSLPAHFDWPSSITPPHDPARFVASLNAMMPRDIAIRSMREIPEHAHARFDATSRTYMYYVHHRRDPFLRPWSLLSGPLDYEAMNSAAALLLEVEDFTSFAKLHSDAKTNICHVSRALWQPVSPDDTAPDAPHCFVITADRFLRNMVRATVGTLVEVGRGKLSPEGFADIINRRDRCAAGTSMPPHPLFLHSVTYPF